MHYLFKLKKKVIMVNENTEKTHTIANKVLRPNSTTYLASDLGFSEAQNDMSIGAENITYEEGKK